MRVFPCLEYDLHFLSLSLQFMIILSLSPCRSRHYQDFILSSHFRACSDDIAYKIAQDTSKTLALFARNPFGRPQSQPSSPESDPETPSVFSDSDSSSDSDAEPRRRSSKRMRSRRRQPSTSAALSSKYANRHPMNYSHELASIDESSSRSEFSEDEGQSEQSRSSSPAGSSPSPSPTLRPGTPNPSHSGHRPANVLPPIPSSSSAFKGRAERSQVSGGVLHAVNSRTAGGNPLQSSIGADSHSATTIHDTLQSGSIPRRSSPMKNMRSPMLPRSASLQIPVDPKISVHDASAFQLPKPGPGVTGKLDSPENHSLTSYSSPRSATRLPPSLEKRPSPKLVGSASLQVPALNVQDTEAFLSAKASPRVTSGLGSTEHHSQSSFSPPGMAPSSPRSNLEKRPSAKLVRSSSLQVPTDPKLGVHDAAVFKSASTGSVVNTRPDIPGHKPVGSPSSPAALSTTGSHSLKAKHAPKLGRSESLQVPPVDPKVNLQDAAAFHSASEVANVNGKSGIPEHNSVTTPQPPGPSASPLNGLESSDHTPKRYSPAHCYLSDKSCRLLFRDKSRFQCSSIGSRPCPHLTRHSNHVHGAAETDSSENKIISDSQDSVNTVCAQCLELPLLKDTDGWEAIVGAESQPFPPRLHSDFPAWEDVFSRTGSCIGITYDDGEYVLSIPDPPVDRSGESTSQSPSQKQIGSEDEEANSSSVKREESPESIAYSDAKMAVIGTLANRHGVNLADIAPGQLEAKLSELQEKAISFVEARQATRPPHCLRLRRELSTSSSDSEICPALEALHHAEYSTSATGSHHSPTAQSSGYYSQITPQRSLSPLTSKLQSPKHSSRAVSPLAVQNGNPSNHAITGSTDDHRTVNNNAEDPAGEASTAAAGFAANPEQTGHLRVLAATRQNQASGSDTDMRKSILRHTLSAREPPRAASGVERRNAISALRPSHSAQLPNRAELSESSREAVNETIQEAIRLRKAKQKPALPRCASDERFPSRQSSLEGSSPLHTNSFVSDSVLEERARRRQARMEEMQKSRPGLLSFRDSSDDSASDAPLSRSPSRLASDAPPIILSPSGSASDVPPISLSPSRSASDVPPSLSPSRQPSCDSIQEEDEPIDNDDDDEADSLRSEKSPLHSGTLGLRQHSVSANRAMAGFNRPTEGHAVLQRSRSFPMKSRSPFMAIPEGNEGYAFRGKEPLKKSISLGHPRFPTNAVEASRVSSQQAIAASSQARVPKGNKPESGVLRRRDPPTPATAAASATVASAQSSVIPGLPSSLHHDASTESDSSIGSSVSNPSNGGAESGEPQQNSNWGPSAQEVSSQSSTEETARASSNSHILNSPESKKETRGAFRRKSTRSLSLERPGGLASVSEDPSSPDEMTSPRKSQSTGDARKLQPESDKTGGSSSNSKITAAEKRSRYAQARLKLIKKSVDESASRTPVPLATLPDGVGDAKKISVPPSAAVGSSPPDTSRTHHQTLAKIEARCLSGSSELIDISTKSKRKQGEFLTPGPGLECLD